MRYHTPNYTEGYVVLDKRIPYSSINMAFRIAYC